MSLCIPPYLEDEQNEKSDLPYEDKVENSRLDSPYSKKNHNLRQNSPYSKKANNLPIANQYTKIQGVLTRITDVLNDITSPYSTICIARPYLKIDNLHFLLIDDTHYLKING